MYGRGLFSNTSGGWIIRAPAATADIGCRICSSTNTSPCVSSRKHRMKRRRRCASRLRPTSSPASSCSSAESARTMWAFGPRRPLARRRRTARRSGRRSSVSMRCAHPIAPCSVCWSGAAWKLSESCQDSGGLGVTFFFFHSVYALVMVHVDIYSCWCNTSETAGSLRRFNLVTFFLGNTDFLTKCKVTSEL
jgi:hypothetical protein